MKRPGTRLVMMILLALAMVSTEVVLLGRVDSRDISMALLAAGGAHTYRTLLLGGVVLAVRLLTRLVLPGAIVYAAGGTVLEVVRSRRAG